MIFKFSVVSPIFNLKKTETRCFKGNAKKMSKSIVPDTASYIRGWMQMVLTPNDLFSWNNKYSKYRVTLLRYIHYNGFTAHLPAMHIDLLCACWCSWAVKGSSSLSLCRLLISLRFTSRLLLCLKLTDASYSGPGTRPPLPHSKWRLHSQDPRTLPSQGARHLCWDMLGNEPKSSWRPFEQNLKGIGDSLGNAEEDWRPNGCISLRVSSQKETRKPPRPNDHWVSAMPGRNIQVHYVHSNILAQSERPL